MWNRHWVLRDALLFALALAGTRMSGQTTIMVGNTEVVITEKATDLNVPWDMVLGPDGWVWFTEIDGTVSRLDPNNGTLQTIYTVPDVHETGLGGGLQCLAFHPDFTNQPYVYVHYVNSSSTTVVKRCLYDAGLNTFTSISPHLLSVDLHGFASHNGSRLVLDDAGMFLLSVGDCMGHSGEVQDLNTTYGKILRFDPEGGIPANNPIPGSYVYNWGHRNPQGLVRAANGVIYNSAHGAGFDDEVNVVLPNRNYGWPTVAGLCTTPAEIAYCDANNVVEPIHEWSTEVVAPSGIDYYGSDALPEWQNSILVATLRGKALHVLHLNANGDTVIAATSALNNMYGRFRDVLPLPDGRILISTSNHDWAGTPAAPNDDRILELSAVMSTGIASPGSHQLLLHPNPASDLVVVDRTGMPNGNVLVHDATGRMVARMAMQGGAFDVSALAPGLYQISMEERGPRQTSRLMVVQRE